MTTHFEVKFETETALPNASTLQSTIHSTSPHTQHPDSEPKTALILEKILDRKIENNNRFYLIKWNTLDSEPIWEPIESLVTCVEAVIDYEVQRRLKNPDLYYEKTCTSAGGGLVSNEKRRAEFDLTDKVVARKQAKEENTKKEDNSRYWLNKREKLVKNSGLLNETQWEDKNALQEISKKVRMSKPFTINPIKFRFSDIMRMENDSEKTSEATPQKVRDRVRRFDTEIAKQLSESKQNRRRGRPRKIQLEHEEIRPTGESDNESVETLRSLIVEIEDSDGEDREEEIEETDEENNEAEGEDFAPKEYHKTGRPGEKPRKMRGGARAGAGRPRKIVTAEKKTEKEKPKPKRLRRRSRKIHLVEFQSEDENKENIDVEKSDRLIPPDKENPLLHTTTDGSAPPKRGRPPKIFEIVKENAQKPKPKNESDNEIESLEDFETLVSQLREYMGIDNKHEKPRRKRGRPRKNLLELRKQETQEIEEKTDLQNMAENLVDIEFEDDNQTQNNLANAKGDFQGANLVHEIQEEEDVIVQGSENEVKEVEIMKEKVVIETKSVEKESSESKSKEGKTPAVSILDQMHEDLMNLESPVDERVFDDEDN